MGRYGEIWGDMGRYDTRIGRKYLPARGMYGEMWGDVGRYDLRLAWLTRRRPGVPRLKFVYVTEPAFVALLPSDLLLLSAGLLSADVLQERVRLLNTVCRTTPPVHPRLADRRLFHTGEV